MPTIKYPNKRQTKEHYGRLVRERLERLTSTYSERFWALVDKHGPIQKHRKELGRCWVWTGYIQKGYGKFGGGKTGMASHRVAWEMKNGPIPGELFCLHKCDNPPCCNPEHLFLGTHQDNDKDREQKGRTAKGEKTRWWRQFGTRSPLHKLTEELVAEIIRLRKSGNTHKAIARQFGVSRQCVTEILRGHTWPHVPR